MIIEKSHDTELFNEFIFDALQQAFERGDKPQGLWVQKYIDEDKELWDISITDSKAGRNMLNILEKAGLQYYYKMIEDTGNSEVYNDMLWCLETIIEDKWYECNNITVTKTEYKTHYERYGLQPKDFI